MSLYFYRNFAQYQEDKKKVTVVQWGILNLLYILLYLLYKDSI